MLDLVSFVFLKLIAVITMITILGIPIFVCWFFWDVGIENRILRKSVKVAMATFTVLGTLTYWNQLWPPAPEPLTHGAPFDRLYYFTFRGYKEQQAVNEESKPPVRTNLGTELRRYRLDDWNPPKHFYVDITDLKTGEKFDNLYVSKHCNVHGQLKQGDEYNITLQIYKLSSSPTIIRYEFTRLYDVFC